MERFNVRHCTLLPRMSGIPEAANLRELRARIAVCNENSLYHHFCETLLRPSFDYPDYHNDFAVWVKLYLDDRVLAERLGILDPFSFADLEDLRSVMLDILDDRLGELPHIHSVAKGSEFYFLEATTVVFNTGDTIEEPAQLARAIRNMTNGSIFFHFIEARRRTAGRLNDISAWLAEAGDAGAVYREVISTLDFTFLTLSEMRNVLVERLGEMGDTNG